MRLSTKIAGWLVVASMVMMTAPGMIVVGLGGLPLQTWLPPMVNGGGLNQSFIAGYLWPIGMPLVVRVLDRWKHRLETDIYCGVVVLALYIWAVLVTLVTVFQFAE